MSSSRRPENAFSSNRLPATVATRFGSDGPRFVERPGQRHARLPVRLAGPRPRRAATGPPPRRASSMRSTRARRRGPSVPASRPGPARRCRTTARPPCIAAASLQRTGGLDQVVGLDPRRHRGPPAVQGDASGPCAADRIARQRDRERSMLCAPEGCGAARPASTSATWRWKASTESWITCQGRAPQAGTGGSTSVVGDCAVAVQVQPVARDQAPAFRRSLPAAPASAGKGRARELL